MPLIIGVDFDGTCVDHMFPLVGDDAPGAVEWLGKLAAAGNRLVLWTMRSDGTPRDPGSTPLADAVAWFAARDIPLWGINANPEQHTWTSSPKAYCQVYVDDAAFGCPLLENPNPGGRPYVDWSIVGPALLEMCNA